MTEREWMLLVWFGFSGLWVVGALINLYWVTGDLWASLSDNPTEDEETIAWQRWRDTLFRLFLSGLFTLTGLLSSSPNPDAPPRVRTDAETALMYTFVAAPIIGSLFEWWRVRDRKHMTAAYTRLYGRAKKNG